MIHPLDYSLIQGCAKTDGRPSPSADALPDMDDMDDGRPLFKLHGRPWTTDEHFLKYMDGHGRTWTDLDEKA